MIDAPIPFTSGLKVIKDRFAKTYLSIWSGPESAPTSFKWASSLKDAYQLTKDQAHIMRAGILSVTEELGGRNELAVQVLNYDDALDAEHEALNSIPTPERVFILHPSQGYLVSSDIKGKNVSCAWNKSRAPAATFRRDQAVDFIAYAGLHTCVTEDVPEGWAPLEASAQPASPSTPAVKPPAPPTAPAAMPLKQVYEILTAPSPGELADKVNQALGGRVQLFGGVAVDITSGSFLQVIVRVEPIQKGK